MKHHTHPYPRVAHKPKTLHETLHLKNTRLHVYSSSPHITQMLLSISIPLFSRLTLVGSLSTRMHQAVVILEGSTLVPYTLKERLIMFTTKKNHLIAINLNKKINHYNN